MARLTLTLAAVGLLLVASLLGSAQAQSDMRCFPEAKFCISGRIRTFWERNGGLAVFGYPIGPLQDLMLEGEAFQAQWFERQRIELHAENSAPYDLQVGRLGARVLALQGRDWFSFPKSTPRPGCRFFAETGHNLCGRFLNAWRTHGIEFDGRAGFSTAENLALWGLPLSDEQNEPVQGRDRRVQWFERARFELHPENAAPHDLLWGLLGLEAGGGEILTPTSTPTTLPDPPTVTPTPGPGTPASINIPLPEEEVTKLKEAAEKHVLIFAEPTRQHPTLYSLPTSGVAHILTPLEEFIPLSAEDIYINPAQLAGRMLGGLTVVQQINKLPPDTYVLTLSPDGQSVIYNGLSGYQEAFPAVIRQLALERSRPIALISALQQCLIIGPRSEICALLPTPPPGEMGEQLMSAIQPLIAAYLVDLTMIDLDKTIPDIEGTSVRKVCADALSAEGGPNYAACKPSALVAPAVNAEAIPRPPEDGTIVGVGVLAVLQPIEDEFFADVALKMPLALQPEGAYVIYDIEHADDQPIGDGISLGRARQDGIRSDDQKPITLYMPSLRGFSYIGTPVGSPAPAPEPPQAVIINTQIDAFGSTICIYRGSGNCP